MPELMKNAFSGLTSRLDMAEGRIFELENISIETSNTTKHRTNTKKKKRVEYARDNCGAITKGETYE